MSFYKQAYSNRMYIKSTKLDKFGLTHGFTSKLGGVSHGKVYGLNLGFRVGDNPDDVVGNYILVSNDLNFNINNAVLSKQTHTDNIRIVTKDDMGKGIVRKSDIEDTDGLITDVADIPLIVFSADCTPILLYDHVNKVAAAVHAGWRGTVKQIAAKCVKTMGSHFNCNPENIFAAIGPCIGECCFEFGSEAKEIFPDKYLSEINNGKFLVDIKEYNKDQLRDCGLPEKNIDVCQICTVCNSDSFYSYRKNKDTTGRQAAIIMIK